MGLLSLTKAVTFKDAKNMSCRVHFAYKPLLLLDEQPFSLDKCKKSVLACAKALILAWSDSKYSTA